MYLYVSKFAHFNTVTYMKKGIISTQAFVSLNYQIAYGRNVFCPYYQVQVCLLLYYIDTYSIIANESTFNSLEILKNISKNNRFFRMFFLYINTS